MATLERAIALAASAHKGQLDKAGLPYILHPLRVMLRLETNDQRIVAVLHDVIEDCPGWTLDRLRAEGFSEAVVAAVDSVTRRAGEAYSEFIIRAGANPIGRLVKIADLQDNSDPARNLNPGERDLARLEKYKRALATLRKPEAQNAE